MRGLGAFGGELGSLDVGELGCGEVWGVWWGGLRMIEGVWGRVGGFGDAWGLQGCLVMGFEDTWGWFGGAGGVVWGWMDLGMLGCLPIAPPNLVQRQEPAQRSAHCRAHPNEGTSNENCISFSSNPLLPAV